MGLNRYHMENENKAKVINNIKTTIWAISFEPEVLERTKVTPGLRPYYDLAAT